VGEGWWLEAGSLPHSLAGLLLPVGVHADPLFFSTHAAHPAAGHCCCGASTSERRRLGYRYRAAAAEAAAGPLVNAKGPATHHIVNL